ncbi:GFA family protein [Marilutibacter maris]|uniref:CENP-V/GFA domain-containing protein n=1 Tax=Marilutibacter maris TaxID=1605891 RepID=A0A2U9T559_9GAMM|nr:hypothetical protein [Lysobacter maris]AWV06114.1 hypothetical protein C9I47_0389 [Lysobacter maris]KAB8190466.1 hypothetical protein FKV24_008625 [Lysobacter maris]
MSEGTRLACACGQTRLALQGAPIMVTECLCTSCRAAAERLALLPGATAILTPYAATPCAEYRKDRVRVAAGARHLGEFRLSADAGTRRVIATCCNTPLFLELKGAHWLSLYLHLWPEATRPRPELRTMTGDLGDRSALPDDIPNLKTHTPRFFAKLFAAWVGMGFRNPKIEVMEKVDA